MFDSQRSYKNDFPTIFYLVADYHNDDSSADRVRRNSEQSGIFRRVILLQNT
jgi:hypothetical protein